MKNIKYEKENKKTGTCLMSGINIVSNLIEKDSHVANNAIKISKLTNIRILLIGFSPVKKL